MPLSYDLTTFLDSRAEICQIFRGIFGKSKISKGNSEIIWPLANDVLLVSKILLPYKEALLPTKLEISHAIQILTNDCQILVLS